MEKNYKMWGILCNQQQSMERLNQWKFKKHSQWLYGMEVELTILFFKRKGEGNQEGRREGGREGRKEGKMERRKKREKTNTKFSVYVCVIQGRKMSVVLPSSNYALINIMSAFHRPSLAHILSLNTHDFSILVKCLTTHLYAQLWHSHFLNYQKYKFHDRKDVMKFTFRGHK